VKDLIIRNGRVVNIDNSIGLVEYCKTHTRYQCYLSEQIKIKQEQEENVRKKIIQQNEPKEQLLSCYHAKY